MHVNRLLVTVLALCCMAGVAAAQQQNSPNQPVPDLSQIPVSTTQPTSAAEPQQPLYAPPSPEAVKAMAPQWQEFCPPEYCSAEVGVVRKKSIWAATLKKRAQDIERNYWAYRRETFEHNLNGCMAYPPASVSCFQQLKQTEFAKNQQHEQERHNAAVEQAQKDQQIINAINAGNAMNNMFNQNNSSNSTPKNCNYDMSEWSPGYYSGSSYCY